MSMHLRVSPVKFGDCFTLVSDTGESFLIDCGSDNRGPNNEKCGVFAYSFIEPEIVGKTLKEVLVTHFDKDHFCGLLEVPDEYVFECMHLPYTIVEKATVLSESMSRLLTIASPYSYGVKLSSIATKFFSRIPTMTRVVKLRKQGDIFILFGREMKVHWPEVGIDLFDQPAASIEFRDDAQQEKGLLLSERLSKDEVTVFASNDEDNEMHLSSTIGKNFDDLGEEFSGICGRIAEGGLLGVTDLAKKQKELEGAIKDRLELLSNEKATQSSKDFSLTLEDYRRSRTALLRAIPSGTPLRDRINAYARAEYHTLIECMNAISIVCSYGDSVLFWGDAPKNVVEHLMDTGEVRARYRVVKLQHHATRNFYSDRSPCAEYGIVSNGGYTRRKVSPLFIDSGKYNRIVCTADAYGQGDRYCDRCGGINNRSPICNGITTSFDLVL